ncbi:MAG: DinB family protein [Anaerolineales bacterium]|nr:DinB family protein [Anaerolineales bacterium]
MISAILFDLDDTLLENDIDRFLPAYLRLLGKFFSSRIDPARLQEALMAGTKAMLENTDPETTLQRAFEAVFFPRLGMEREPLVHEFERFYAEGFPSLRALTRPMEGAARAVELAFGLRWKVAVATNPVFPLAAVEHRLAWAGFNSHAGGFDLVPSYESMHFAKPRPEFTAEVLGRIAATPSETAFIGNDPAEDLAPARALGLSTFRVIRGAAAGPLPATGEGTMNQLAAGLESDHCDAAFLQSPEPSPCVLPALLAGHLAAALHIFGESRWSCCPLEEGWGPVEIACHLRDVEREITQPRLRKILSEENPFLAPVESDPWAEERRYRSQDGPQALRDFAAARKATIALLRDLRPGDWRRAARHALFGPTTLAEQMRFSARHDLLHIEQLQGSQAAAGG